MLMRQKQQNQDSFHEYAVVVRDSEAHQNAQVFNHLIKQSTFMLRNDSETIVDGPIGTRGCVQYTFKISRAIVILCIKMKSRVGNVAERLEVIAHATRGIRLTGIEISRE